MSKIVGIIDRPNDTCKRCDTAKKDIVNENMKFAQKFGLKTSENHKKLYQSCINLLLICFSDVMYVFISTSCVYGLFL